MIIIDILSKYHAFLAIEIIATMEYMINGMERNIVLAIAI